LEFNPVISEEGPAFEKRFRFHPTRRWRADFAHLPSRTLIEIEGGIYINDRRNRGAGLAADLEKYLEANLAGWRVERFRVSYLRTILSLLRIVASLISKISTSSELVATEAKELTRRFCRHAAWHAG
jgi:very-short-patch-repair endonuclease